MSPKILYFLVCSYSKFLLQMSLKLINKVPRENPEQTRVIRITSDIVHSDKGSFLPI